MFVTGKHSSHGFCRIEFVILTHYFLAIRWLDIARKGQNKMQWFCLRKVDGVGVFLVVKEGQHLELWRSYALLPDWWNIRCFESIVSRLHEKDNV